MGLFRKSDYKRLIEGGYSPDQATIIESIIRKDPNILKYIDSTMSVNQIMVIGKILLNGCEFILQKFNVISDSNKAVIIEAFNKCEKINAKDWHFIIKIASQYDSNILKIVVDKMLFNIDYDFIGAIKTALDQNIDLNDLALFKKQNKVTK